MRNVYCLRHRYNGESKLDLSCKVCCEIFLAIRVELAESKQTRVFDEQRREINDWKPGHEDDAELGV